MALSDNGNIESNQNNFENLMESEENINETSNIFTTKEEKSRTAFIPLFRNHLLDRNSMDIMKSVSTENLKEIHPLYAFRLPKAFKLVFSTAAARDRAVKEKLSIFNIRVDLELPREPPTTKRRTLHIYGIPIDESAASIECWLKNQGMTAESEIRWTTYPGTEIRNGGRSIVVSAPIEKEIPGFMTFNSTSQKRQIPIQVWYYGIPMWCRRCKGKGHYAKNCSVSIENRRHPNPTSYAAKASEHTSDQSSIFAPPPALLPDDENYPPLPQPQGLIDSSSRSLSTHRQPITLESEASSTTQELSMQTLGSINATVTRRDILKERHLETTIQKFVPFYSYKNEFSNHFPCSITIGATKYTSTEQFLFSEKAKHMGDDDLYKQIMNARTASEARTLGKRGWDERVYGIWHDFAKEKLYEANKEKYKQNTQLRHCLFRTAPKTLVEATFDGF